MTKPLLLLDFDRTLFDTNAFVDALWQFIAETYQVDREKEQARMKDFYRYVGEQYDYYFFDHAAAIEGVPSADELKDAVVKALKDRDFLYEDAASILADIDAIVTFGNRPYQALKLALCPSLASIPQHITQGTKGSFIERTFGEAPTILIDDKPRQLDLPATTTFIHLDRTQEQPVLQSDGQVHISSLRYYREALA